MLSQYTENTKHLHSKLRFFSEFKSEDVISVCNNPNHLHSKLRFCFWFEIRRCYPSIQKIQSICNQNSDFLSELKYADVTPVYKKSKTFAFKTPIFFLDWNLKMLSQEAKNPKHLHSKLRFFCELKYRDITPVYKKSKTFVFQTQIFFLNWNLQTLPQYTKNPKHLHLKLRFSFLI